jgi:hypothetical protein
MNDETRTRFLTGIAAQIPAERVRELHLFGSIRQGGMESGVAVIALDQEEPVVESDALEQEEPAAEPDALDQEDPAVEPDAPVVAATRYVVYTARYRHTLKGLDRGKWELSVTEEADAPLLTVDAVVRGVSRRSGEAEETERISGAEFRAAVPQPAGA